VSIEHDVSADWFTETNFAFVAGVEVAFVGDCGTNHAMYAPAAINYRFFVICRESRKSAAPYSKSKRYITHLTH
jgi:hypothetical protein